MLYEVITIWFFNTVRIKNNLLLEAEWLEFKVDNSNSEMIFAFSNREFSFK